MILEEVGRYCGVYGISRVKVGMHHNLFLKMQYLGQDKQELLQVCHDDSNDALSVTAQHDICIRDKQVKSCPELRTCR